MPDPLILYSTNTQLAFKINEDYYHQAHYVWCNPYFHADSALKLTTDMPPSSTPRDIFREFQQGIERKDLHSSSLRRNREGLVTGITAKLKAGIITQDQYKELQDMVAAATPEYFRPLLYVIPFQGVANLVKPVAPVDRAALLSREFVIEKLPRSLFDVLWR
jgi:hypothetical protein